MQAETVEPSAIGAKSVGVLIWWTVNIPLPGNPKQAGRLLTQNAGGLRRSNRKAGATLFIARRFVSQATVCRRLQMVKADDTHGLPQTGYNFTNTLCFLHAASRRLIFGRRA